MKMSNLQTLNIVAVALFLSIAVIAVMPVTAVDVSVTRDLPDAVSPGEEFEVSLTQSDFYFSGSVTEKLPEGFKYMGLSPSSGGEFEDYDETTNNLTIGFLSETTITYIVEAGTKEQIETADEFSGTWATVDSQLNKLYGDIGGEATLEFVEPTPTPTPTEAPPSGNGAGDGGNGGGGGGGGIPPAPPAETLPYVHLNATPANIPADGTSTSTITASVWDGDEWVMENLTVNFSADSGDIPASAAIVNGTATGILTAGTEEGIANVRAEANLSGDIGVLNATTMVNFTTPGVTPTPTATPTAEVTPVVTATETPTAVETPTATPAGRWGIPGFEVIFAIAGLLAVAYLVLRRRRRR